MDLFMMMPRKMNLVVKVLVTKYLKDTRLKSHHLMIINEIGMCEGPSQKDLTEHLPFDKSYISTGVRELIEYGYVINNADGKIHSLELTDSGREISAMARMLFGIIENTMFDTLTDDERKVLGTILEKIDKRSDDILESVVRGNYS